MPGKNFSRNNTGKRKESDFYETAPCLVDTFLDAEEGFWDRQMPILEPASGHGAIVNVLKHRGFKDVISYDLVEDGVDFLQQSTNVRQLITNPPYSLAHEFILHAKEVVYGKFALLLPLTYLQGSKRLREIWSDSSYPLEKVYVFNRYPMLGLPLREDGKIETGMMALAWFIWNRGYQGEPKIKWLDIDKYILKKRD
jgi:hypothetical protein